MQVHVNFGDLWNDPVVKNYTKSIEQGAATSVYAALSEEWKNKGGRYLSNCVEEQPTNAMDSPMMVSDDGFAPWAYDPEAEKKLWKMTCDLVGVKDD